VNVMRALQAGLLDHWRSQLHPAFEHSDEQVSKPRNAPLRWIVRLWRGWIRVGSSVLGKQFL
jgi:hypothetical protein